MEDVVRIFDTTLRDGEQAPGCTIAMPEKLEIARQLARLGVDIIEAGFPAASPGDWEAVHTIAREVGTADGPVICGLARANRADIERCWTAIEPAARRRIHTFLATSDLHLEHKLRMSRARAVDTVAEMVAFARALCEDVEFSPEDATRSEPRFLYGVLEIAIQAGATTLNIPDTVGYATPGEYAALLRGIRENVPGIESVTLSVHCHDDLGLATANSLAGIEAGARQVEGTINGIGERAGNASLEEVVMALATRAAWYGARTRVRTREIARTSRLVATCTGVAVPPNKAIVGAPACAHEAGIHQDGVLKRRDTYEIMRAESVGMDPAVLVLGKHSGRHALRARIAARGHELSEEELDRVFARFKEIADRKRTVDDRDLEAIVASAMRQPPATFALDHVQVSCGTQLIPTATVRLRHRDGSVHTESAQGDGPVDAVCRAIDRIIGEPTELTDFSVHAITEGINAVGEVTVRLRAPGIDADGEDDPTSRRAVHSGYGVNVDIVVAAAEAYLGAMNRLLHARVERAEPVAALAAEGPS